MGRKSNTKKVLQEKIKEHQDVSDKPLKPKNRKKLRKEVKAQLQKNVKKQEKIIKNSKHKGTRKKMDPLQKQRLFGGIVVGLSAVILLFFGFLIFQRAFRAMPLAKLLPAEQTVAFVEINTDQQHNQYIQAMDLLGDHKQFLDEKIMQKLENFWGLDFEKNIRPWLGRQMGLALIKSTQDTNAAHLIYFAEIKDREGLQKMLDKNTEKKSYKSHDIYVTTPSSYMTVMEDYLIVGIEEVEIQQILDANLGQSEKLYYASRYRKVDNNMPLNRIAQIYVDFDMINESVMTYLSFFSEKGLSMDMITPIAALFDSEGMSLIALDDQFALQSFVSLDRDSFSGSRFVGNTAKYRADLAKYVNQEALSFWGGENFGAQIDRLVNVIAAGDKAKLSLLSSLVENYAQRYFGTEISLENDIAPLLSKEFALALEMNDAGKANYKLLIELKDPEIDGKKLNSIINQFAQVSAIFEPTVVDYTLPDGTYSQEIVASPQAITTFNDKYRDFTIHALKTANQNWGIYYSIIDEVAVVADSADAVKGTIDLIADNKPSLKQSAVFSAELKSVVKSSDEISYFNIEKLVPILLGSSAPEILEPIAAYSSGRNYFYDGITGIGYLQLK